MGGIAHQAPRQDGYCPGRHNFFGDCVTEGVGRSDTREENR